MAPITAVTFLLCHSFSLIPFKDFLLLRLPLCFSRAAFESSIFHSALTSLSLCWYHLLSMNLTHHRHILRTTCGKIVQKWTSLGYSSDTEQQRSNLWHGAVCLCWSREGQNIKERELLGWCITNHLPTTAGTQFKVLRLWCCSLHHLQFAVGKLT